MPIDGVTAAVLPAAVGNISLVALFLQAHIVVKIVILGLLFASVWSWAIIVDKTMLYGNTRRQMDRFEKIFWSGQSLEELYRSLTGRTPTAMASVFVAAMREWKRSFEAGARSPIGLQTRIDKVLDVTIGRETERLERRLLFLATVGSAGPVHRPFRHRVGHHDQLPGDRRVEEHLARGGGAGHRRSAARHRARAARGDSGGDRL